MNIISRLLTKWKIWKTKMIIGYLKNSDPQKFLKMGENKLIPAFQRAAKDVPAYKKLLQEKGVDAAQVKDIESFKKLVPIIDKEIFVKNEITDLCVGGNLKNMKSAMSSSGFSGTFSYGISSKKELKDLADVCDILLDFNLNINWRKTFFINSLGMGVKVYTGLPIAETSVRSDVVLLGMIKKFAHHFEQVILLGNPYFLKKVVEEGLEEGINWKQLTIHLIMGEDWFPESFRSYLAQLLGIDFNHPEKGIIGSTMGICELGLTLFQESIDTIRIRRLSQEDEKLHAALFGEESKITPILFHSHPYQMFLENINGLLVFTTLSKDSIIPLIRYNSKDKGKIITYQQLASILTDMGHQDFLPQLKLPLVAIGGRGGKFIEVGKYHISVEQVKEGLYSDFEVAAATTGYFRMSKQDNHLKIEVQLKEKMQPSKELKNRFLQAIAKYVKTDFELILYLYREFPYGMELNYEKKFKYI